MVISSAESWALPPNQIQTRTWSVDPGGAAITLTPSSDGSTVTVSGMTDGTAVVRLTVSDGSNTAAATANVTVASGVAKNGSSGGGAMSLPWLLGLLLATAALRRRA
jgi:hypothetical protein